MAETEFCNVCGQPADDTNSALCNECDQRFHLRLRANSDGPECGEVWINAQYLSMEFACNKCLGAHTSGETAEPPVGRGH